MGLGCVGIVVPVLPTVPFFLLTVLCFAKSSTKMHDWFLTTSLYHKYLKNYMETKGLTLQSKITILLLSGSMMVGSYFLAGKSTLCLIVLLLVYICHVSYFVFCIKTLK